MKKEFQYLFQISKLVIFSVSYYTLGDNGSPYFSTSVSVWCRNKKDISRGGQCQEEVLSEFNGYRRRAYDFYKKWDHLHLHVLKDEEYDEMIKDINKLKEAYNYAYSGPDKNGFVRDISIHEEVALSKLEVKKINKEKGA